MPLPKYTIVFSIMMILKSCKKIYTVKNLKYSSVLLCPVKIRLKVHLYAGLDGQGLSFVMYWRDNFLLLRTSGASSAFICIGNVKKIHKQVLIHYDRLCLVFL